MRAHDAWRPRLAELGAERVVGTRPIVDGGRHYNEAFAWTRDTDACIAAHRKRHLPEEEGFWESSWYTRGDDDSEVVDAAGVRIGFAICTEIWFHGHARACGRRAAHVIASPRATLASSTDKWIAGGRTAAVVSGAFSLSSNFRGSAGALGRWGGTGWIIDPEEGDVLGTTSPDRPFLTLDIDLARADAAKSTYPRYVPD
ncbi:MAG: carbon-nitrogen hydrolase family protein [Planctomycetes bacterium]|nr:carbon-nitrogen hydrolase family protein [Planctomycetota bacterium]